jgi:hypothetical protein
MRGGMAERPAGITLTSLQMERSRLRLGRACRNGCRKSADLKRAHTGMRHPEASTSDGNEHVVKRKAELIEGVVDLVTTGKLVNLRCEPVDACRSRV